jgi:ketosteroid isomerase-like protein
MSVENDIRKASDKFYAALNSILNGDWTPMSDVWSRNPEVSTMHPVGGTEVGWDEIRASWENLAKICLNGRVELRDQRICVGEDLAYVTGTEHVNLLIGKDQVQADLRVSNVFRREGSEWKMVHHHVDRNLTMLEILSEVETSHQT